MSTTSQLPTTKSLATDRVTQAPTPEQRQTSTPKRKILITGATGSTGTNAIARLLELHVPVRALVHKLDERSEKLSAQGVEIIQGDLSDFATVSEDQHIAAVAQDCRDGVFSGTNDLVEKLTGRKPLPMVDYIVKNKALFN